MTSIEFHYRPSTRDKRSRGSVFIRVIHRRKTSSITTRWKLYPDEWDCNHHKPQCLEGNERRFPTLMKIDTEMKQALLFLRELAGLWELEDRSFAATDITLAYRCREGQIHLSDFIAKLYKEMRTVGKERTARAYQTTGKRFLAFAGNDQLQLKEITGLLVRRFEMMLQQEGKSQNTISFYMRNLRAIYNKAVLTGLLEVSSHNPFENVYTGVYTTRKRALTSSEMKQINDLDLLNLNSKVNNLPTTLQKARQLFLFCFLARGMSYIDMAYLKKENIHNGIIRYRRKKTSQPLEVKINSSMQNIIRSFEKETKDSPYVFPIIDINKNTSVYHQYESGLRIQNKRLKEICKLCGIHKPLSTHVARHSWATIAKEKNVPLIVISEGLGHTSEKTTSIYLGSLDRSLLDRAGEKVARAIKTAV